MSLDKISKKLRPDEEEVKAAFDMYETIKSFIKSKYGLESVLVGSVGKGTFIKDDKDLDIFILFNPETPKETLKSEGLKIGKDVFAAHNAPFEIAYAEHPYVSGIVDGYAVEIVPCYDIKEPSTLISSVDRTPFHLAYVLEKMNEKQKDEVRLLKRFLKAQKLYGADARAQGFSGYLCELMILHYTSFQNVVANAVSWGKKTTIPLTDSNKKFDDPLTLVDPVDPERNVASAVRVPSYARFILACRTYELTKSDKMFVLPKRGYVPIEGGKVIGIGIYSHVIEDTFFAQSRRFLEHIITECEHHGFSIYQSGFFKKGILLDIEIGTLPPMEKHMGPPLYAYDNARAFEEKYGEVTISGPDKLCTFKPRKYTDVIDVINDIIKEKTGMGIHLKRAKISVIEQDEALSLASQYVVFMR